VGLLFKALVSANQLLGLLLFFLPVPLDC